MSSANSQCRPKLILTIYDRVILSFDLLTPKSPKSCIYLVPLCDLYGPHIWPVWPDIRPGISQWQAGTRGRQTRSFLVSQGSTSGPLGFVSYTKDVVELIDRHIVRSHTHLYADNTQYTRTAAVLMTPSRCNLVCLTAYPTSTYGSERVACC